MAMSEVEIRRTVYQRVTELATAADWSHLTIAERSAHYVQWTENPEIGGLLLQIMEPHRVRVYLKDTIIGSFAKTQRPSLAKLLSNSGVTYTKVTTQYIKPHAMLCDKKALYTLAAAKEWKGALLSAFERAYEAKAVEIKRVYFIKHVTDKFIDSSYRAMIEAAAKKLGVTVCWVQ